MESYASESGNQNVSGWWDLHQTTQSLSQELSKETRKYLYNSKGVNLSRGHKNSKYICTKHQDTEICKANINRTEGKIDNEAITIGDKKNPCWIQDRSSEWKIN